MLVICGCLWLSGIISSTVSAQPDLVAAVELTRARRPLRRSGRRAKADPRDGIAASYSRYSSDNQDECSLEQQQRRCRAAAEGNAEIIASDLEFADSAVSGTKRDRTGLQAMLAAARAGRFATLYVDSLSRLSRESVLTMPMLKEMVYVLKVRVVSVTEGIDSSNTNWDLLANFMAWVHEQYLKGLRDAVLRGQEHAVLQDWSCGDWCFGYDSEPIPGSESGRRGRHPKPRMRVVVHPEHAEWVRQIFRWFVVDGWSMRRIVRELNRRNAPKDHRATTQGWHHNSVRRLLENEKYVGLWPWGRLTNTRNPLTGQIYQEERPVEEVAKWVRERPHLRLIADDVFARAQARLDEWDARWREIRGAKGRIQGSWRGQAAPRHLLQGLVRCAACGRTYQVCGAHGAYLGCSGYLRGLCPVRTRMPRALAEDLLLKIIGHRLLNDPAWLDGVVAEADRAWRARRRESPSEVEELKKLIAADTVAIRRLGDLVENSDQDVRDLENRLWERTRQRKERERQLAMFSAGCQPDDGPPTRAWVEAQVGRLHGLLRSGGADANGALRQLTGGAMSVSEREVPGRKRKFLVGTFTLPAGGPLGPSSEVGKPGGGCASSDTEVISVEFREPPPWAEKADEVMARVHAGEGYAEIAATLGWTDRWVAKARAWWYTSRGLAVPDGRTDMARPARPTMAETIRDRVMPLWDAGFPIEEIAEALRCSRDVVRAAVRQWHEAQGLPVPDGRRRRREVNEARKRAADVATGNDQAGPAASNRSPPTAGPNGEPSTVTDCPV